MKRINTTPISGMQELLPGLQAEFNQLKAGIEAAFHAHGFQSIETPTIDRAEILLAKAGGDTEKQIYKVVKTAEASEGADQALRFDHTVPLSRYVVEHANDLAFPFRVTQIGRNFRGERAQKGRFREFYQCDADVIGWQTLPVAYDAEVILTLIDAMRTLPLPSFYVRISNRKLLQGMMEELNLQHQAAEIFNVIDHAEKVPPEATAGALRELGIGDELAIKLLAFIQIHGSASEVIPQLEAFGFNNATFKDGVAELKTVLEALERNLPADDKVSAGADLMIVRGLDYYTGTVFETIVPEHREIGSICGGGRYENLASHYTEQKLPGVGGSIGLTRLFYILREYGFVKVFDHKPVEVCVVPISVAEIPATEQLATRLRKEGKSVDVIMTEKKLGDKLKYAASVARYAVVVGADEAKSGEYKLKDLATGEIKNL